MYNSKFIKIKKYVLHCIRVFRATILLYFLRKRIKILAVHVHNGKYVYKIYQSSQTQNSECEKVTFRETKICTGRSFEETKNNLEVALTGIGRRQTRPPCTATFNYFINLFFFFFFPFPSPNPSLEEPFFRFPSARLTNAH